MAPNPEVRMNFTDAFRFLPCLLLALSAHAGTGGSLVGNGAGLAELEIAYAYSVGIPETISYCLNTGACELNDDEESSLRKIQEILERYPDANYKIHFLSEKELPGFFDTGVGEHHRIAKTDSKGHSVIFINRDALYDAEGRATVDMPLAASILVHELGHQIGIGDHTWLDALGSKVRAFLSRTKSQVVHPGENLAMTLYSSRIVSALGFFVENETSSLDLSSRVTAALVCPRNTKPTGTLIQNPHWEWRKSEPWSPREFVAFVRYHCADAVGGLSSHLLEISIAVAPQAASGKAPLSYENVHVTILRARI